MGGGSVLCQPVFYAFTYPQRKGIERTKISPDAAGWPSEMGAVLPDFDTLRQSPDPDAAMMSFLETTYQAGATAAGWHRALLGSGKPAR